MTLASSRTADPYRDVEVIDARAPRFNQATVGAISLVAVLTGWWPLLAILAAQLAIGLRFGRRWCLPCVIYFEIVQPRFGEGPVEDSRPPRFANYIGLVVLGSATLSYRLGLTTLGAALGLLVAALALLAAATGFCAGCFLYRVAARTRGSRAGAFDQLAMEELGLGGGEAGDQVVAFTHPLCTDCHALIGRLRAAGRRVRTIDVRDRPDLARKYGVAVVPMAFAFDERGGVLVRVAG